MRLSNETRARARGSSNNSTAARAFTALWCSSAQSIAKGKLSSVYQTGQRPCGSAPGACCVRPAQIRSTLTSVNFDAERRPKKLSQGVCDSARRVGESRGEAIDLGMCAEQDFD